jgi:UDP-N-acetylmuramate--alanine ligase
MTIKPDLTVPIPGRLDRVHFVGVGGAGMSGIARLFLDRGAVVSGSDRARNTATDRLIDAGATIAIGHAAGNVGEVDAVVVTSALWPDNPELLEARRRGVPVLHRSQALKALIGTDRLVSVAGAHGKTTSTGMLAVALDALGADPSFVNGGIMADFGISSRIGGGDLFVVEADESDGSFLLYDTAVALITNVDADHLDHYGSAEAFDDAFVAFADEASEVAVISSDDPGALRVAERVTSTRVLTFGESADADVRVTDITTDGAAAGVLTAGDESVAVRLRVPGRHNVVNAAGAVAVLLGLGYGLAESAEAVARFGGTGRRFELKGRIDRISVYDDYAHHPTEVAAALTAARTVVGDGRIIAVHQPHLYSRTQAFAGEFAVVLERTADHTIVLDVDGAREDPVPGVTGALVADRFTDPSAVDYEPDWAAAADRVAHLVRPGDFVVTLGCGSVYRIVPELLEAIGDRPGAGSATASGLETGLAR